MANKNSIWDDNIIGKIKYNKNIHAFYVDKSCKFCGLCGDIAPENFSPSDDDTHYFVSKVPCTSSEVKRCIQAMNACPEKSIGDDL